MTNENVVKKKSYQVDLRVEPFSVSLVGQILQPPFGGYVNFVYRVDIIPGGPLLCYNNKIKNAIFFYRIC